MAKEIVRTKTPSRRPRASAKPAREIAGTRQEDIARRAFEIYMSRGAGDGNALGDWVQAERELLTTMQ